MLQAIRQRVTGTTNAGTAADIPLPQVKPGEVWRITHLALYNESGESVDVQFGLLDGSSFAQVWAKETVADGDAYGAMVGLLLLEGDKLDARVTGSAKKSKVSFIVSGELITPGPDIVEVVATQPAG